MDKESLDSIAAAISNGRTDIVRTLINLCENGNVNNEGTQKEVTCDELLNELCTPSGTLLHFATKLDHIDIVRTLLSAGADPTVQNATGQTSYDLLQSDKMAAVYVDEFLKCAAKSEVERMKQLVEAGVDVNSHDSPESKNTAMHWAVCFGKPESVQCLLDLDASPNVINGKGHSPLHDAVTRKNVKIVKLLLAAGGDPWIKSADGPTTKTPFEMAENHPEILNLLNSASNEIPCNGPIHSEDLQVNSTEENLSHSVQSISISPKPIPMHIPQVLSHPLPLVTESKLHLLWPQPQYMIQTEGPFFKLKEKYSVSITKSNQSCVQPILDVWDLHVENFLSVGAVCEMENVVQAISQGDITCYVNPKLFNRQESYKLMITTEQMQILASDTCGLHYALCSLGQLFRLYEGESIPLLYIHDSPQLSHRGVLLDLSLGARNPTLESLKHSIQIMSNLKMNYLHCYFRYEESLPYTNKELISLARYCMQHYIRIIPVIDIDPSATDEQIKMCNKSVVQKLMTLFSSEELHVGPNLSKLLIDTLIVSGPESFWSLLSVPSSTLIFLCSNDVTLNTGILNLLPFNTVFVEYGYQVEYDFDHHAKLITHAGFNVCIGAGTASWGSITGCPETALTSIHRAAQVALAHGSYGLLVADWKPSPHHTAFCFSWPGILLALGMSWNSSIHIDYLEARAPELLDHFVFRDSEHVTASIILELGRLEALMHQSIQTSKEFALTYGNSILQQMLIDPDEVSLDCFTSDVLQQAVRHLKKYELLLQKAKPECFQNGEIVAELRLAMDLLIFTFKLGRVLVSVGRKPNQSSCGLDIINIGIGNLPAVSRTDLANRLLGIIEQFRAVWLSRNLPCGLHVPLFTLNSLLYKLIPDSGLTEDAQDQLLYPDTKEKIFSPEFYENGAFRKNSLSS